MPHEMLTERRLITICETTPRVKAWSGYASMPAALLNQLENVHDTFDANLFFWYFGRCKVLALQTLMFTMLTDNFS